MSLPEDYLEALGRLALAFSGYRARTGGDAVLVGGAATAIFTAGAFRSADFDVVAADDLAFDAAMAEQGFRREDRREYLHVGFYHPEHLAYGFQQVSGRLFDGRSDPQRLVRMTVLGADEIVLPSVEDLIADRLGQYAVAARSDVSRLEQARWLLRLAEHLNIHYLRQRILDEGGDPALLGLGS